MEFFKVDHEIREIDIQAFDYPNKKVAVIAYIENEAGDIFLEQKNTVTDSNVKPYSLIGTEVLRSDINYRFAINRVIKDTYGKKSGIQIKDTVGIAHIFNDGTDYVYVVYNGKLTQETLEIKNLKLALDYKFMKKDEIITSDTVEPTSKYVITKIKNLGDVGKIKGIGIDEAIKQRHSVRKFLNKKIEGGILDELQEAINNAKEESNLKIELVLNEEDAFGKSHYGNFENCKNYIVIIGDRLEPKLEEKAGYYGEKIVIRAQELGLNTCWVALTYNKAEVPIKIESNESLVIVIAIGYGVDNGHERKSKKYKDVTKVEEYSAPSWYKKGIDYALLAPTAINQQKFRFDLKDDNKVSARVYGLGFCTRIDLGIAKYHFEVGAGKDNFEWTENSSI